MSAKYIPEPFRIKMVETINMLTREERKQKIAEAKYNMFNLRGEDVYIDLLTDSGTNAMSAEQWAGVMRGDEAYAGSSSYYKLVEAGQDIFGYKFIQPVHQGRAAEKVMFGLLLEKGKYSISNTFFDTTRAHVEATGARAIDCVVDVAKDPAKRAPFKGNMNVEKLESLIKEYGADKIGLVVMTVTNNSAGGQPVSVENVRETSNVCKKYGIKLCIDAARYAENAYFVKLREKGYATKSIKEIVKEMFSYADMFTMSAKKDTIVNMGGLIGIKDDRELFQLCKARTILFEGFITYGGLSGRDLESLAIGLYEGLDEEYLKYRNGQMEYLAGRLDEAGISYQSPVGGHGVFVDAKALLPQIPYYEFPGQALGVELYIEAGIRACDIGSYMLGNDPDTGKQLKSEFEFTRLAIPRRVYTQSHIDIMADALISIKARASEITGYKITWEPSVLRHFQASLEPVKK
ncbi:tryptophanase [Clostridium estertheticum]|uniref:Tryptophanase n=1 Tax=Clostridium estertheticum TaxID=238834 RepID=A0A5N7IJQ6_9CLOT|nr:tryptophanase [Clostridium estertheticum]MPQ30526.1 tryptophanase [Clostridium estertheticum]MPQ61202.1 tryptophanase [Clostridium estertheticum]